MQTLRGVWLPVIVGFITSLNASRAQTLVSPVSNCREFTTSVTIDGQVQQATGRACQRPDGTWQIIGESPPDLPAAGPTVVYSVPYPQPYYPSPPVWIAPPVFVGSSFFFVDHFQHFHHFHHQFDHRFDHRTFVNRQFVHSGTFMHRHH